MSSFKRKITNKQATLPVPGTRTSPASSSVTTISTGIPSLDDVLGGGLPLSCCLLVTAPDLHSSYGELIQKYFLAEGLACRHRLCVVDGQPKHFVKDIMWIPGQTKQQVEKTESDEEEDTSDHKVKIAWRYEQMKPFQTTVSSTPSTTDSYGHPFELSIRAPTSLIDDAFRSGQLSSLTLEPTKLDVTNLIRQLEDKLQSDASTPLRICIPSLGSPFWGDVTKRELLFFLHSLKSLLRKYPHGCASVGLSPHLSADNWGGAGWLQKLGWISDAALSLSAFSGDISMSATFPKHHGLVQIQSLPCPTTLVAPSDRFSVLRGLVSSSSGGSGENNLAFKCTRKRLMIETLHLDLEGGVAERRTTAPVSEIFDAKSSAATATGASVRIELEEVTEQAEQQEIGKVKKAKKKRVAFDVYDF